MAAWTEDVDGGRVGVYRSAPGPSMWRAIVESAVYLAENRAKPSPAALTAIDRFPPEVRGWRECDGRDRRRLRAALDPLLAQGGADRACRRPYGASAVDSFVAEARCGSVSKGKTESVWHLSMHGWRISVEVAVTGTRSMALGTQFHRKLDQLWGRRSARVKSLITPKAGMPPKFSRSVRTQKIGELLDIASAILVRKFAKKEFQDTYSKRRLWRVKGRGVDGRGEALVRFARSLKGPLIYVFWRGKQCLYVGKGKQNGRLAGYQRHYLLLQANAVEVFSIPARSQLPKAECLATHLFSPKRNRVKPARVRWGKKCPVCRRHDEIKQRLNQLFPLRR